MRLRLILPTRLFYSAAWLASLVTALTPLSARSQTSDSTEGCFSGSCFTGKWMICGSALASGEPGYEAHIWLSNDGQVSKAAQIWRHVPSDYSQVAAVDVSRLEAAYFARKNITQLDGRPAEKFYYVSRDTQGTSVKLSLTFTQMPGAEKPLPFGTLAITYKDTDGKEVKKEIKVDSAQKCGIPELRPGA